MHFHTEPRHMIWVNHHANTISRAATFKPFLKGLNYLNMHSNKLERNLEQDRRARKPVIGCLRTTKAQTSLRIRAV